VRFLFANYYTQANWDLATGSRSKTNPKKMWEDDATAQIDHDKSRDAAGTLLVKGSGFFDEASNKTVVTQKWPRALEIRPIGSASQSVISRFLM
jgi:hypothetical protein